MLHRSFALLLPGVYLMFVIGNVLFVWSILPGTEMTPLLLMPLGLPWVVVTASLLPFNSSLKVATNWLPFFAAYSINALILYRLGRAIDAKRAGRPDSRS